MPAHADYDPWIKGPVGSAKFCASVKNYDEFSLRDYQVFEKTTRKKLKEANRNLADLKKVNQYQQLDEARIGSLRQFGVISTIYSTWCK
tara:strand:+ start:159 stop:425 length:267 start_codon:yes stop_codon:yes gene_type:complete